MHTVTQLVDDGAMPFHAQQLNEGDATFYQDDMDALSHVVPSPCALQDKFSSRSNVVCSFFTRVHGLFEVQEEPGARARLVAQPLFGNESPYYQPSAAAGLEAAAQPSAVALTQSNSTADNDNLQQSPTISGPAAQELYQLLNPLAPPHSHPHSPHQPPDPLAASPANKQAPAAELYVLHSPAVAKLIEGPGPVISSLRLQHGPVEAREQQSGCFNRTPAAAGLITPL
ncbi:hypothetical protein HaLaN_08369 [Haematococcus lacustris]|uniref:Uncharacterized protein n=1 Tax=Haematococcus lacustris TaxID=44745 RepID=A0A699YTS7_HAELA|nr:hypothetical protein HaLaN_08369 [Haematococcus lacustris]